MNEPAFDADGHLNPKFEWHHEIGASWTQPKSTEGTYAKMTPPTICKQETSEQPAPASDAEARQWKNCTFCGGKGCAGCVWKGGWYIWRIAANRATPAPQEPNA